MSPKDDAPDAEQEKTRSAGMTWDDLEELGRTCSDPNEEPIRSELIQPTPELFCEEFLKLVRLGGSDNVETMRQLRRANPFGYLSELTTAFVSNGGLDLRGLDLKGADFSYMGFENVDFRDADLRGANFSRSFLIRAKLQGAKLQGAELFNTQITDDDLVGVDVTEVDLLHTIGLKVSDEARKKRYEEIRARGEKVYHYS